MHSPRLLLTSAGITTPHAADAFRRLFDDAHDAAAGSPRAITYLATAQMAPSATTVSKRSPTELRRRRWADARKKARLLETELSEMLGDWATLDCVDCARDSPERLAESLRSSRAVWVAGGNTFWLWHHMRTSGMAELVMQRVSDEGMLYIGCSAGAIVAGDSIETAYWKGMDDPAAAVGAGADWSEPSSMRAMGLARGVSFFPHMEIRWDALVRERSRELRRDIDSELITLEDVGFSFVKGVCQ